MSPSNPDPHPPPLPQLGEARLRDIGGLPLRGGLRLRRGLVYRSGELSRLDDQGLRALSELGLEAVIDLRTPRERSEAPDRLPPGVRVHALPLIPQGEEAGRLRLLALLASRRLDFQTLMLEHYHHWAFAQAPVLGEALRRLAEARAPSLVHCTVGKDRTGLLVAVLQLALGAEEEAVLAHYLESAQTLHPRARDLARRLRWAGIWPFSEAELAPVVEVRALYLQGVLDRIRDLPGGLEGWLDRDCGVDAAGLSRLRDRLSR